MTPAGIFRRIAALFYDLIILLALFLMGTLILMPLTHGHFITAGNRSYQCYLFFIMILYFCGFWLKTGQTLGMLSWKIKLISTSSPTLTLGQCLLRFFGSLLSCLCLGIGIFWLLWDKEKKTFYDHFSRTQVILYK